MYKQLSKKQQAFCKTYIENEDRTAACAAAGYKGIDNINNVNMLCARNFKHPVIKALLAHFLGYKATGGILSRKELMLAVSEGIRFSLQQPSHNTPVLYKFCILLAELKGWTREKAQLSIPDLVQKMESKIRKRN